MKRVHDLGGKTGFGPIDTNEKEEPFHADFEGKEWALARLVRAPSITVDWWRHVREMIPEEQYLTRPYFDSWAQTDMAAYIEAGYLTLEELLSGNAAGEVAEPPKAANLAQVLEDNRAMAGRFDRESDQPPKFALGEHVMTNAVKSVGHTRLPEYAQLKTGQVIAQHGTHIFPDESSKGNKVFEHLYTVSFSANTLWGDAANQNDSVSLDLWESYLNVQS